MYNKKILEVGLCGNKWILIHFLLLLLVHFHNRMCLASLTFLLAVIQKARVSCLIMQYAATYGMIRMLHDTETYLSTLG